MRKLGAMSVIEQNRSDEYSTTVEESFNSMNFGSHSCTLAIDVFKK